MEPDEAGSRIERRFGWRNVFVGPDEDPRVERRSIGERDTLTDYLHAYRQTLQLKCGGLDAAQMARRSVPPSNMSLLGLVRHMADVERFWFRMVLAAEGVERRYRTPEDPDNDFNGAVGEQASVDGAWAAWEEEVAFAEDFVRRAADLDATGRLFGPPGEDIALREVLVHMIEEYARHCGHADLIRERIDGRVGQ